jgi:hypothetical protein
LLVIAEVALVCWNSDELLVAMNEPDAAVPRKFVELATGMMDEELLSAT